MHQPAMLFLTIIVTVTTYAQGPVSDSVVVPLAQSSKIIFTIRDRSDLEVLRHYDFQKLFEDIFEKLETSGQESDSAGLTQEEAYGNAGGTEESSDEEVEKRGYPPSDVEDEENDGEDKWAKSRRGKVGQTWHSYNIDLGTNNYLQQEDQFPGGSEPYAVRPWGSWYVAANSVQRTRVASNVFVEWALGVSWYNFKFQNDNTLVEQDEAGVRFVTDSRDVDFTKSKLSATFINASLVPVLDFGEHSRKRRVWDGRGDGFRFGAGPYVGYRIASKSKLVYEENGERQKDKNRDDFHFNNLRYGFRLQLGVRSTDLFVNYDMNDLFAKDKGPSLNAISFGLIF